MFFVLKALLELAYFWLPSSCSVVFVWLRRTHRQTQTNRQRALRGISWEYGTGIYQDQPKSEGCEGRMDRQLEATSSLWCRKGCFLCARGFSFVLAFFAGKCDLHFVNLMLAVHLAFYDPFFAHSKRNVVETKPLSCSLADSSKQPGSHSHVPSRKLCWFSCAGPECFFNWASASVVSCRLFAAPVRGSSTRPTLRATWRAVRCPSRS